MENLKLETKILGIIYEEWWHDTIRGIGRTKIGKKVDDEPNKISQALKLLENEYLIKKPISGSDYIITASGIEKYEEILPPSVLAKKEAQREKILKVLEEMYDKDTDARIQCDDLGKQVGIDDFFELFSQMKYLENKGYVQLLVCAGHNFYARLLAEGKKFLVTYEKQQYQSSTNAYCILYILENRLRYFIKRKLKEKYDSDWWEQGISDKQKTKADERRKEELGYAWKISDTDSEMDYLSFSDLSKIITTQWNVFKPIFKEIAKIELPLKQLEEIRNAIAHTRTLSADAMTRLEQYNKDIFNLTK